MSQYFPKPFRRFGGNINVKVDLSNYATKTDLKNVTHVDTLSFARKTNLASIETEVTKLDIDKLAPVLVDLSKLSDVVKNDVVKNTVHDKLVTKVNNINNSLATKTALTTVENKISSVCSLVIKKQNMTQKLLKLKINLVIIIITNILLLQRLILYLLMSSMQD